MSYFDASALAAAGANLVMPGFHAAGQNVSGDFLTLTSDAAGKSHTESANIAAVANPSFNPNPRPEPTLAPQQARHELLRRIWQSASNNFTRTKAGSMLRRSRSLSRFSFGPALKRAQAEQENRIIEKAVASPRLMRTVDPNGSLRAALNPQTQPLGKGRYTSLNNAAKMQISSKPAGAPTATISAKQLKGLLLGFRPQRGDHRMLKNLMAVAINIMTPGAKIILEPAAAIATTFGRCSRPAFNPG